MRKINVLTMLAVLFTFSFTTLNAYGDLPSNKTDAIELRNEINLKIQNIEFDKIMEEDVILNFLVNNDGKLIVVSSNDTEMSNEVIHSINYTKLKSTDYVPNKLYTIKVRFLVK